MPSAPAPPDRSWGRFELGCFASVMTLYAFGLSLGMDRVGAAPALAAALQLTPGPDAHGAASPLDVLALRLASLLPIGDLAVRGALLAAVLGALCAVVLARLVMDVCGELRPASSARRDPRALWHEPVAGAAAAGVFVLALGSFTAATSPGRPLPALLITVVGWRAALRLSSHVDDAATGLRLALVAGLGAASGPTAALFLWPPAALLTVWALRRGERWPLIAPLVFVAGLAAMLLPIARAAGAPPEGLLGSLFTLPASPDGPLAGLAVVAAEAGEQVGVLGVLLAAVGAFVLVARAPFAAALIVASAALALIIAAQGHGPGAAGLGAGASAAHAFLIAIAATALCIGMGVWQLAGKIALARFPTAVVLAVTALVFPALDGGADRWRRDLHLSPRLLEAAHGRSPLGARVDPGTAEMEGLLRYGAALGLRPDLRIGR